MIVHVRNVGRKKVDLRFKSKQLNFLIIQCIQSNLYIVATLGEWLTDHLKGAVRLKALFFVDFNTFS